MKLLIGILLFPELKLIFLRAEVEFPYWLDAQRYVVKALEQKGGNYYRLQRILNDN